MSSQVAVLSQKGGVGKTTITLGLASAAWAQGLRTLVIDVDAQANATYALGVNPSPKNFGSGDAIKANREGAASSMIVPSGWSDDIWLLPASGDLTERDSDALRDSTYKRLKKSLVGVADDFDLVLIDCSPSLGHNTTNALTSADRALLVVEPTIFGLQGVGPVLDLIDMVWNKENRNLDLAGVILNRVPAISNDAEDRVKDIKKLVGASKVWKPNVPMRVLVNKVHTERSPLHSFGAEATQLKDIFDKHLKSLKSELSI